MIATTSTLLFLQNSLSYINTSNKRNGLMKWNEKCEDENIQEASTVEKYSSLRNV